MTALELHIELEQQLERINSQLFGSLLDSEKSWWLNRALRTMIKNKLNPLVDNDQGGHQNTRKRIDDLEELITTATLQTFKNDSESTFSVLPYDYLHPVNEDVKVLWNCAGVSPDEDTYNTEYIVLPFKRNYKPGGATNFYEELIIRVETTVAMVASATDIFDPVTYPAYASGVGDADEYFYIIHYIMENINKNDFGVTVYWEKYKDLYHPESFIIVAENWKGDDLTAVRWGSSVDGLYTSYSPWIEDNQIVYSKGSSLGLEFTQPLRIVGNEDLRDVLNHSFSKTVYTSPVGVYRHGMIYIYHDNTFVPELLNLEYYRIPKKISLVTNVGCELRFAEEIPLKAAEMISGVTLNPNYQALTRMNMTEE